VLLDHAGRSGVPVSLLQHDIVVPIELRLGAHPLAPPTLVRLVLSGLQEREGSAFRITLPRRSKTSALWQPSAPVARRVSATRPAIR
jgi:hypothetical protein